MVSYGTITDEKTARDFFDLVQDHLYRDQVVADPTSPKGVVTRRCPAPRLALFARRGTFIAAISAKDGDRLVGLYILTDQAGKAHIDVGYVVSKYRRLGIGAEMLERSYHYLQDQGRQPVFIDVRTVEMVRLVVRLRDWVRPDTLMASVSLDQAAKDLSDDLYE